MSEEAPRDKGAPHAPRQHAYPTPVAPPPQTERPWGADGGGPWDAGGPWDGGGTRHEAPYGGGPGAPGSGNGDRWRGGQPQPQPQRRTSSTRGAVWTLVAVAVVLLLLRAHRLTTTEVILFCVLLPSVILHEISHGVVAWAFGDDTARRAGRLSLNPWRHVDLVGTIIVPAVTVLSGFGFFGWAKPVPVNVGRLRSPRNHGLLVALAGPFTNVVVAAVAGLAFYYAFVAGRFVPAVTSTAAQVLFDIGAINLWVAFFNLIPVPPLDGSAVVERLLPASWWPGYLRLRPYGLIVIIGGLVLLSMVHVYPLAAVFGHIGTWWAHLLGV